MAYVETIIKTLVSENPKTVIISLALVLIGLQYKYISMFADLKEILKEVRKEQEKNKCQIEKVESKVNKYHSHTTDKFNLLSNEITDKWTKSMNNLVDRLSQLSKDISNILVVLRERE